MVFQQFALMPWRSVRDNVGLGLELRGVARADRDRQVDEMLHLVRLEPWADKRPHELSGGMQQRVGLARALATDAEILLMDEPFSALDPLIREHLQDELLDLQRSLHKTIVFVSHDLDESLKLGSRIAIMEGGAVIQIGRPVDIVANPVNDYVRAFLANVNPLNVLTASQVMRPPEPADAAALDLATAPPDAPLRRLVALRHDGGRPVRVVDGSGETVGIVGLDQILSAIDRRQPEADHG